MNSRDGKCDGSNLFFLCISLVFYFTKLTGLVFFFFLPLVPGNTDLYCSQDPSPDLKSGKKGIVKWTI